MRSTFVAFWKATAILQFGVACVWFAPPYYKNKNQPEKEIRYLQTIGSKILFYHCAPFFVHSLL